MIHSRTAIEHLRRQLPEPHRVAEELYGIHWSANKARCPFPTNHAHEDRDPSLRYDPKKKRIFCASRSCFGQSGVDAFGFVMTMDSCRFPDALNKMCVAYGLKPSEGTIAATGKSGEKIPALKIRNACSKKGWRVTDVFQYSPTLRKVRLEHLQETQRHKGERPSKTYLWESERDGTWYSGSNSQVPPLYVNAVFKQQDSASLILGFEGENKADAAGRLGYPAFSYKEATRPETFQPIAGKHVVLWRDKDQKGEEIQQNVIPLIARHALSIRLVEPPDDLPESGDILDSIAAGLNGESLELLLRRALPYRLPTSKILPLSEPRRISNIEDIPRVESCEDQQIEWALDGLIAMSAVTMITGDSGSGKSTLVAKLAHEVSAGRLLLGRMSTRRPALLLDRENSRSVINERFKRLGIVSSDDFRVWGQWLNEDPPPANSPLLIEWILRCEHKPLIIIDSFIAFLDGDENDAAVVRACMADYRKLAAMGCAVVILHHVGKGEASKAYRGSSDIKASIDVGFTLTNSPEGSRLGKMRLRPFKSRFATCDDLSFNYADGAFAATNSRSDPGSDQQQLQDLFKLNPRMNARQFDASIKELGLRRSNGRALLHAGIDSGRIVVESGDANSKWYSLRIDGPSCGSLRS